MRWPVISATLGRNQGVFPVMSNAYLGFALLLGVLAVRWALGYWRMYRLKRWWALGNEALVAGDLVVAEAAFRTCAKLVPVSSAVRRLLGGLLARRGKLREAEEQLRFGADLEPRNPAGHMDLGFFLALCVPDRTDEAIDAFGKALEYEPDLRETLRKETRLEPLRRDDRFRKLLETPD